MILVTVSDDRFGRKNGAYEITQSKIKEFINKNPQLNIVNINWTFKDITDTIFYRLNKTLLDNTDAARNGRAYKPFVILETLKGIPDGDFIIYNDCSPEMWYDNMAIDGYYDTNKLKALCEQNGGILSAFVKWDTRPIPKDGLGIHTHENFTTERCIKTMGLEKYTRSFMHASGFMVIQKLPHTMQFMEEWLHWNTNDECACLGKADVPGDYSYWDHNEEFKKMGHRHDQSVSGLLINKYNYKLIDIIYNTPFHTYNFLNFCKRNVQYKFIDSNYNPETERRIKKGDTVTNTQGTELKVFEIFPADGIECFHVGLHRESMYRTTANEIKLKQP